MRYFEFVLAAAAVAPVAAQTYTKCNPLKATCPADPALGKAVSYDFTKGPSSDFTVEGGTPSYDSNGVNLPITKSGEYPTLISKWFIMFGHIDIVMKTAPGAGIVNSLTMQSDDLDEIDWEWLGSQNGNQVQTNYFGKGITGNYDRGTNVAFSTVSASTKATQNFQADYHTYSLDWTADQLTWSVDGVNVRTLKASEAESNQYPQTPLQLKVGIWAGGDPSNNAPGVVTWSGGPTDFSKGPFTMQVKSVKAIDYSTGQSYSYGDMSGNWQSIKSSGGSIKSSGNSDQSATTAPAGGSSSSSSGSSSSASSGASKTSASSSQSTGVKPAQSDSPAAGLAAGQATGTGSPSAAQTTLATSPSGSGSSGSSGSSGTTPSGTNAASSAVPTANSASTFSFAGVVAASVAGLVSFVML